MIACLWVMVACGADGDDRMVRRYAECLVDTNTALHCLTVSSAVGSVPLTRRRWRNGCLSNWSEARSR